MGYKVQGSGICGLRGLGNHICSSRLCGLMTALVSTYHRDYHTYRKDNEGVMLFKNRERDIIATTSAAVARVYKGAKSLQSLLMSALSSSSQLTSMMLVTTTCKQVPLKP